MATLAGSAPHSRKAINLAPDRIGRVLGVLSIVLFGFVLVALARGAAHWGDLP